MSYVPQGPPPASWYALGGNSDDLAYFDGRVWTWRRWRLPGGEWRQEPIRPPSATLPEAMVPPRVGPTGSGPAADPTSPNPGVDRYWHRPPPAGSPSASGVADRVGPGGPARSQQPPIAPPTGPAGWGTGSGFAGASPSGPGPGSPAGGLDRGGPRYPSGPGAPWPGGPAPGGPWSGGPWSGAPPTSSPSGRLELHLSEPRSQARWATLLRGLLIIPNVLVLEFLLLAAAVVTVVMWFSALLTARVPEGMWRFSKGVLQWSARTDAYAFFLTDKYPPFTTGDVSYPVSMTLERPDRFNRLAVLFRVVLVIPAAIVASVFTSGVYVLSAVTWLVTLVLGRCPRSFHVVLAAWLRYELRYSAYYLLLSTAYPSAPLGDPQSGYGSLESGEIVLRGASKAVMVMVFVLGVLLFLSDVLTLPALVGREAKAQAAIVQWDALQSRSAVAQARFRIRVGGCGSTWRCTDRDLPILVRNLDTQISTIQAITFPTSLTRDDADAVLAMLRKERSALVRVQKAGTAQTFDGGLRTLVTLTHTLQPLVLKLHDDLESTP